MISRRSGEKSAASTLCSVSPIHRPALRAGMTTLIEGKRCRLLSHREVILSAIEYFGIGSAKDGYREAMTSQKCHQFFVAWQIFSFCGFEDDGSQVCSCQHLGGSANH